MVAFCQPQVREEDGETTPIHKRGENLVPVRVKAFGSGAVIVPRFDVDVVKTTCGQLFESVEHYYIRNGDDADVSHRNKSEPAGDACPHHYYRLICGKQEMSTLDSRTRLVCDVFDVANDAVIYVVAQLDPLWQRQCLLKLFDATGGEHWWRKWDKREPIQRWVGVKADKVGNILMVGRYQDKLLKGSTKSLSGTSWVVCVLMEAC